MKKIEADLQQTITWTPALQEKQKELAEFTDDVQWYKTTKERINELASPDWHLTGTTDDQAKKDWIDIAEEELKEIDSELQSREKVMQFDGPHDKAGAIITIQAGAGGTDAMDWAEMLERMYLRWAENKAWPTFVLDRSTGEEAGIKHSTFEVNGLYAYGLLKGERGVHRLVRQSPFNADKLRQTSFARVEVVPLLKEKEMPAVDTADLRIDTYRAGGAGGQHVNKTSSAVRITHLPTGIVVQCQNERSQGQNKAHALAVLQSKLQLLVEEQHAKAVKELKGDYVKAAWGNQIRSYVLHPYKMVKDHRTKAETSNVQKVLEGDLTGFIPKL
ncbi:MAG: peptide chain release factor 2 [Candidatus Andersenbacteria bacterium RIFCSPLOWO2_12_FULL_45_8]|nr:MAG: peptide chain release factor 2 [Candidatus Andersenbacteria bacterium RIFCSPHIGHO2_02_FULL_46_16]OGY38566.1 MAG: peptide chain release factor 2 [Candidatus Andersenbacteria bacterium RIFCSPLOWO2_12_FULL_45_8]HBE90869.1 peptide chain release factor 2 [Candidatus Andersenbacteria bacterium]